MFGVTDTSRRSDTMAGESTPEAGPTQPPPRRTDDLLATLAERIGARFDARTVFGAPVERDGVTVIPVAAIRFCMGGGGGSDPSKGQGGEGGGGGGSASAAGYIEIKDGRTCFVPVVHRRAHAHAHRRDDAGRPGDRAAATRRAPAEPVALELSAPMDAQPARVTPSHPAAEGRRWRLWATTRTAAGLGDVLRAAP